MSSQKSISVKAVEPKRERGRSRVAAILDAGTKVFAEKGYDAATMTEIAARSKTAIGSLYRFFPTKEILADALLTRYGDLILGQIDAMTEKAAYLSPSELADALIDLMMERRQDRAAAHALIDGWNAAADRRSLLRAKIRSKIAHLLMTANTMLTPAKAGTIAVLLLHIMKAVPLLACEGENTNEDVLAETRELARLYISHALESSAVYR